MPDGNESLSQLGLCSGDTLWVLGTVEGQLPAPGPNSVPAVPAAAQAVSSSGVMRPQEDSTGGSKRTRQDGALAKDEEDPVKPGSHYPPAGIEPASAPLIALNSVGGISAQPDPPDRDGMNVSNSNTDTILDCHAKGLESESVSRQQSDIVSGSSPRHPAMNISPMDISAEEQAAAPCARNELLLQTVPGHLKRVLSASVSNLSAEGTEANGAVFSPHALLLAAAHAALLETGFLPSQASAHKVCLSFLLNWGRYT